MSKTTGKPRRVTSVTLGGHDENGKTDTNRASWMTGATAVLGLPNRKSDDSFPAHFTVVLDDMKFEAVRVPLWNPRRDTYVYKMFRHPVHQWDDPEFLVRALVTPDGWKMQLNPLLKVEPDGTWLDVNSNRHWLDLVNEFVTTIRTTME